MSSLQRALTTLQTLEKQLHSVPMLGQLGDLTTLPPIQEAPLLLEETWEKAPKESIQTLAITMLNRITSPNRPTSLSRITTPSRPTSLSRTTTPSRPTSLSKTIFLSKLTSLSNTIVKRIPMPTMMVTMKAGLTTVIQVTWVSPIMLTTYRTDLETQVVALTRKALLVQIRETYKQVFPISTQSKYPR
uniref:Uncharacterized protein n=1 Tax=Cacopsylla melanoneura TaxID=428564 RepID=A0A8D8U4S5_9HEMI